MRSSPSRAQKISPLPWALPDAFTGLDGCTAVVQGSVQAVEEEEEGKSVTALSSGKASVMRLRDTFLQSLPSAYVSHSPVA